jgi:hypothetical protein
MITHAEAWGPALCVVLLAAPLKAQELSVTHLTEPDQVSQRGFTKLVGMKELRDGRVILVDEVERLVLILDAELREGKPIGREGAGPGEYIVPSRLFSFVGDSSAVYDSPNNRLLVLTPDGEPGGVLNFFPGLGSLKGGDGQGRLYSSTSRGTVLQRWSPPSPALDTVAVLPPSGDEVSGTTGGMSLSRPEDQNPFPPEVQWAVAADGRLAIVHPDPYRVETVGGDGARLGGPEIPVDQIKVTEAHKEQWRERMSRPTTAVTVRLGGRGRPAYESTVMYIEPKRWPEHLPPFLRDAATFAPDGRLWVQRTTTADAPLTFDVFDKNCRRVQQITLPHGRRLIGFGKESVYAVVRDDLDLEYLERYSFNPGR